MYYKYYVNVKEKNNEYKNDNSHDSIINRYK
jgi:hypothetical protein